MTHLLVLAGTGEARQLLAQLATNPKICITASLVGQPTAPRHLVLKRGLAVLAALRGLPNGVICMQLMRLSI